MQKNIYSKITAILIVQLLFVQNVEQMKESGHLRKQPTAADSLPVNPTLSTAGWVEEIAEIITSDDYPVEDITLERLFKYLKIHRPSIFQDRVREDEQMLILLLAISNHSRTSFMMEVEKILMAKAKEWYSQNKDEITDDNITEYLRTIVDTNTLAFRKVFPNNIYSHKLNQVEKLDAERRDKLTQLESLNFPSGRWTAFAIAQYFGEGYAWMIKKRQDSQNFPMAKKFFELCTYPETRRFIGQWERDYAQELTFMSAAELQEEWNRIGELSGYINEPLYLLTVNDFLNDTIQYMHPYIFVQTEEFLSYNIITEKKAKNKLLIRIAKMNIYLEWASRHWGPALLKKSVRSIPQKITPDLGYIEESMIASELLDNPFKQTKVYEILRKITDREAEEFLGMAPLARSLELSRHNEVDAAI